MIGRKDSPEEIIKGILKLDALEFLGICKIIGVNIYEQYDEGGRPIEDAKNNVRPFENIWGDVCDTIDGMNRTKRRNLNKLVRAATKKEK